MQKIPLLFKTDEQRKYAIPEVNPVATWVFTEPTIAHRKYDGTAMRFDGEAWWSRRQVKNYSNGIRAIGFEMVEHDPITDKAFGWELVARSPFHAFWKEAREYPPLDCDIFDDRNGEYETGTYELLGPKINANPENLSKHRLMPHNRAQQLGDIQALELDLVQDPALAYAELKRVLFYLPVEGVVFKNRTQTKFAKLRRKDFDFSKIELGVQLQESRERQRNWLSPLSTRQNNDGSGI